MDTVTVEEINDTITALTGQVRLIEAGIEVGEVLIGLRGTDDKLFGGDDNNVMVGGRGDDSLYGRDGHDWINTGNGLYNDVAYGGAGNDTIEGGYGDFPYYLTASLFGGAGDDVIFGGEGITCAYGGAGDDFIYTRWADDTVGGGAGDDFIFAGDGNDVVRGGDGNDLLFGDNGNDVIKGGRGDDNIHGAGGDDTLTGGQGNDTFVFVAMYGGNDTITDFNAGDRIEVTASSMQVQVYGEDVILLFNGGQSTVTLEDASLEALDISVFPEHFGDDWFGGKG